MAYCPNTDKGENTYTINYGTGDSPAKLHILGRSSNQHCCTVHYTATDGISETLKCIEPAVPSNVFFPEDDDPEHGRHPPPHHIHGDKRI